MSELTELISLDNWRKIRPIQRSPGKSQLRQMLLYAGWDKQLVPPIHELQVDPVPVGFEMWQDAEGKN